MSMEISGNYKDYKNEYLERAQTAQLIHAAKPRPSFPASRHSAGNVPPIKPMNSHTVAVAESW